MPKRPKGEPLPSLFGIADRRFGDPVTLGRSLFRGGARLVQIRDKSAPAGLLVEMARSLLADSPKDAIVIVNDRADVALVVGTGGVHLGQTDLPAPEARTLLGDEVLIGVSTHSLDDAVCSQSLPIDYIAAGPVFPTSSKEDPDPVIGIDGLRQILEISQLPVFAIGGIRLESVPAVMRTGAAGVAVIGNLVGQEDIELRTRQYLEVLGRIRAR